MRRVILAIAASLLGAITAHADIQADARKIQDANQDAVVYLSAVIEIERRGGTREASLETLGTIISERGLQSRSDAGQRWQHAETARPQGSHAGWR